MSESNGTPITCTDVPRARRLVDRRDQRPRRRGMTIPRIPSAADAPGHMTREQVTTALATTTDDEPLQHWADRCFTEPVVHLQAGPDGSVR